MNDASQPLARLERHLGRLLVAGVTVAAACLALGLVLHVRDAQSGIAASLLRAGLFVLISTPILRVVVSIVEYVRMRDWFFTATTVVVLVELAVTLFYAFTRVR